MYYPGITYVFHFYALSRADINAGATADARRGSLQEGRGNLFLDPPIDQANSTNTDYLLACPDT